MKRRFVRLFAPTFFLLLASCVSRPGQVFSPDPQVAAVAWTDEEKAKDLAIKTLRSTQEASFHLIRLRTVEPLHAHDAHDVAVFILRGRVAMRLEEETRMLAAGDVIEIPRGVVHAAVNRSRGASVVYAVFTPPYDGKDRRLVE